MQRPGGVVLIAVLCFIGAAIALFGAMGIGMIGTIGAAAGAASGSTGGGAFAMMAGLGAAVAVAIMLALGTLDIVIGVGLLKLRNWARIATIVLAAIGFIFTLISIVTSMAHFTVFGVVFPLIAAAIDVWIALYLLKPNVKAAFSAQAAAATA